MRNARRFVGLAMALAGLGMLGWLGYDFFVRQPPRYAWPSNSDPSAFRMIVAGLAMMCGGIGVAFRHLIFKKR